MTDIRTSFKGTDFARGSVMRTEDGLWFVVAFIRGVSLKGPWDERPWDVMPARNFVGSGLYWLETTSGQRTDASSVVPILNAIVSEHALNEISELTELLRDEDRDAVRQHKAKSVMVRPDIQELLDS